MRAIILLLLAVAPAFAGGCEPPGEIPRGVGFDQSCRMFRREVANGQLFILRLNKNFTVKSREAVDCGQAVYDPDGSFNYYPKSINGRVWCSAGEFPEIARKLEAKKIEARAAHMQGFPSPEEEKAESKKDKEDKNNGDESKN